MNSKTFFVLLITSLFYGKAHCEQITITIENQCVDGYSTMSEQNYDCGVFAVNMLASDIQFVKRPDKPNHYDLKNKPYSAAEFNNVVQNVRQKMEGFFCASKGGGGGAGPCKPDTPKETN
jgi:hypothetical protein